MFLVVDQRHNFYQRSKNALETVWVSYLFFPDVLCLIFVQVSLLIISGLRLRACLYMCARVWICDVWASVSVLWLLYLQTSSCDKSLLHSRMEMPSVSSWAMTSFRPSQESVSRSQSLFWSQSPNNPLGLCKMKLFGLRISSIQKILSCNISNPCMNIMQFWHLVFYDRDWHCNFCTSFITPSFINTSRFDIIEDTSIPS